PQLLESLRRPDAQGHEMTLSFGRVFANSFGSIVGRHEEYSVAMIASPRAPLRQRQSRTGRERINVIWPQFARRTSAGTVLLSMIVLLPSTDDNSTRTTSSPGGLSRNGPSGGNVKGSEPVSASSGWMR